MPSSDAGHRWTDNITWYLLYITAIAVLGPLQFGYHLVWPLVTVNAAISHLIGERWQAELNTSEKVITCQDETAAGIFKAYLPRCIPMTTVQFGLVSSIFTLGGLVGALSAGVLSTRYGRLLTMRLTTACFIVGPVFEALASNVPLLLVGRTLSGLGAGGAIVVVPVYISEVSPPTEKGMFGALTQVAINLGIVTTQFLGLFLSRPGLWRITLGVAGGIGALQLLGLFGVMESPQYLSCHGKQQAAKKTLTSIRSAGYDVDGEVKRWSTGNTGIDTGRSPI